MIQRSCILISAAVASTLVGCDPSTVDPTDDRALHETIAEDATHELAGPRGVITYDDLLAQVADEAPEFAGMYYAEDGALVLVLLEPDVQAEVESALASTFGEALVRDADAIRVEVATFSFSELKLWHDRLTMEILAIPGTVLTDIDERNNIVRIGVVDADAARRARARLRALQIPSDVVIIEVVEPPRPHATLRDVVRPLVGGLQIPTAKYPVGCTLGFPAIHGVTPGFVTNSHCTDIQGGVEATQVYSPTMAPQNWVGTEALDPLYWTNGCAPGLVCRYSDAAFIASNGANQGRLAVSGGLYDLTMYGTSRITQAELWPVAGQPVSKTGRTTSTTSGNISHTCSNIKPGPPVSGMVPYELLCNYAVLGPAPMSDFGDSGSPAYTNLPHNRKLVGVVWGGAGSNNFWFSSLGGIFGDMGPMKVCVPNKTC